MVHITRRLWESPPSARFRYYLGQAGSVLVPRACFEAQCVQWFKRLRECRDPDVFTRAAYYHRQSFPFKQPPNLHPFRLNLGGKRSTYQLDLYAALRYFPREMLVDYVFGDVREVPSSPAIVKSRPIAPDNAAAILMNLNKVRHFYFVQDPYMFREKRDVLVWRGRACQQHRKDFLAQYYEHPLCDVGHYHPRHQDVPWIKPELSVRQQLECKYVFAIEGNDVATNLKWALASRSLCFMACPKYETWFMEGLLVPGQHYVALRDDYADLDQKISYYNRHPDEAEAIVDAANQWVAAFRDPVRERLIGILVLWRYLFLSGQMVDPPPGEPC